VFAWLQEKGSIADREMYRVFNMGMGMLVVVGTEEADRVPRSAGDVSIHRIGEITAGDGVTIV
jgi:phosphoribosylformylglycinamidine cyclo-ligase